ncbi:MAG TPA: DCC1-like thiol-disulfide oxidoreductase family protein [Draconibacterium sp.]|nr:DCC1-like thiol-disulfide oxidoreductase family protein [Draconibacterium sp.]
MEAEQAVILFDGFCNLCNGTVNFLLKYDKEKQFSFIPLQSDAGKKFISKYQIPADIDSVLLIKSNRVYFKSDAAVEIAGMLNFPWKLASSVKIIPRQIRDKIYNWVAKNRYHWFGKRESCRIPDS